MSCDDDSDPDLVIDDGQVYGRATSRPNNRGGTKGHSPSSVDSTGSSRPKARGRIMRAITKRLKPIYIGPLQPDSSGMLNVRGHLGFMVLCFGLAAIGFTVFELIPFVQGNGFYCPSVAIPFGILSICLANSEFSAMNHKSISPNLNRRFSQIGLVLGGLGASVGCCVNILGWLYYIQ